MISSFSFPTTISHGAGWLDELPKRLKELGIRRPLVVTDRGLLETEAFGLLRALLPQTAVVFSDVHPNPVEADVTSGVAAWKRGGCDGVIGFGGGSALDVAKILRVAAGPGETTWRDLTWKDDPGKLPAFIAIPTTAGTGSEVGRSSVIIFEKTKRVIFHPALLANLVILDPAGDGGIAAEAHGRHRGPMRSHIASNLLHRRSFIHSVTVSRWKGRAWPLSIWRAPWKPGPISKPAGWGWPGPWAASAFKRISELSIRFRIRFRRILDFITAWRTGFASCR